MDKYALDKGRLWTSKAKYCYWERKKLDKISAEVLQLKFVQSYYNKIVLSALGTYI